VGKSLNIYCLLIIFGFCNSIIAQTILNDTVNHVFSVDSTYLTNNVIVEDSISNIYIPEPFIYSEDDDNEVVYVVSGEIVTVTEPTSEKFHSPHRASMYAAVIPGLGQIYNRQYWKLPILFGGIGGVVYAFSFNSERYGYYRNAYRDFIIRDPANKSYLEILEGTNITEEMIYTQYEQWFRDYLNNSRKRFRRYRDISYAGIVAVYLISIIDASIDAHFYYFDISDNLSFLIEPAYFHFDSNIGIALGLSMKLNF